ncbi:histidinol dehydrogenase [Chlamydiota bacterium]
MKRIIQKDNNNFINEIESIIVKDFFDDTLDSTIKEILNDVYENKDDALCRYTFQYDNVDLIPSQIRVKEDDITQASTMVGKPYLQMLEKVKKNIETFYLQYTVNDISCGKPNSFLCMLRHKPLESIGVYIPGGSAPLVSTVLMTVVVAQVAGVKEITVVSPPTAEGTISPYILAACQLCGIANVFRVGGAQAIAALAFGTQTIPKVDKIVGPGNKYVTAAKRLVYGSVDIDMVAGPSEILVFADKSANPSFVTADLLSQAEHDPDSRVFLVTDSYELIEEVEKEISIQLQSLSRKQIILPCLNTHGFIILVESLLDGISITNKIAPEHCEVMTKDAYGDALKITNAGAVFVGNYTPESVGDYIAGPSHVLPTGGSARFFSGLSVSSFLKSFSLIHYSKEKLLEDSPVIEYIAQLEGLEAHRKAVEMRTQEFKRE